jgi:protein SFI1
LRARILTDLDIVILHDIVVHAQELLASLPERERVPTNALFHAYYAILPSIGIDADHDNRYARILFKIGGTRGEGSLFEKFETVLSHMGIEIQFDRIDTEHEHIQSDSPAGNEIVTLSGSTPDIAPEARGRQRRNSESSIWDKAASHIENAERSPRSQSVLSRSKRQPSDAKIPEPSKHIMSKVQPSLVPVPQLELLYQDNKRNVGTWLTTNPEHKAATSRARSLSSHRRFQIQRGSLDSEHDERTISDVSSNGNSHEIPDNYEAKLDHDHDLEHKSKPLRQSQVEGSSPQFEQMIPIFIEQRYNQHLAQRIIYQWRQRTIQTQEDNANLELLARHRDREVLLRQGFETWRMTLRSHHQEAETKRFFTHLERRAGRARDLFLLAKAFTHWASSASDELQKTSLARRHILRTRFFKAWREITAVNELKVRRHVLRKFFTLWRQKHTFIEKHSDQAVIKFQNNIVSRTFWIWFWTFCERRAPTWWADRLKRRQITAWTITIQQFRQYDAMAEEFYRYQLTRKTLVQWTSRARAVKDLCEIADGCCYQSLCRVSLDQWHRKRLLLSPALSVRKTNELRLKKKSIQTWLARTRQIKQAIDLDCLKIKREALVAWKDKVRCRTLQRRIDDRLLLQALYKWVLAERLVLARRLQEQRLTRNSLLHLHRQYELSSARKLGNLLLAQTFNQRNWQMSVLKSWKAKLKAYQQKEQLCLQFSSPKLLFTMWNKWATSVEHVLQLDRWAKDGEFYFLTSKTLKKWKALVESTKRDKMRNAYTNFRRKNKLVLASRVLSNWRQKNRYTLEMKQHALDIRNNETVVFGIKIFDHWKGRANEVCELQSIYAPLFLRKNLTQWQNRFRDIDHLNNASKSFYEEHRFTSSMKIWTRSALQIRAHEHLVLELREKYFKRSFRKMFSHWQQRTAQLRHAASLNPKDQDLARGILDPTLRFSERAETWSQFEEIADVVEWARSFKGADAATPVPGYLSTPSRRTSRIRTMGQAASTTPSAPLSTPFERRLRAQFSRNQTSASEEDSKTNRLKRDRELSDVS